MIYDIKKKQLCVGFWVYSYCFTKNWVFPTGVKGLTQTTVSRVKQTNP